MPSRTRSWGLALWVAALAGPVGARAQEASKEPPASAAFAVAVVVAGDPGPDLRDRALEVRQAVAGAPALRGPSDPGLARALAGEPASEEDDGLERARAERRRLGWGEGRDVPVLERIGRMTGARLVLVVRRGSDGPEVVAFDVGAGAFYEGALDLPADAEALRAFALTRARAAAVRPPQEGTAEPKAGGAARSGSSSDRGAPKAATTGAPDADEKPAEPEKRWIAKYWPYLVAGALLAGTVTFFVVRGRNDQTPKPVLRFELGGSH